MTWNFEIQFIFSLFCILRSNATEVVLTTHLFRKIIFHKQVSLCHGERLLLSLSHFLFFQELFAVWKKKKKEFIPSDFLKVLFVLCSESLVTFKAWYVCFLPLDVLFCKLGHNTSFNVGVKGGMTCLFLFCSFFYFFLLFFPFTSAKVAQDASRL